MKKKKDSFKTAKDIFLNNDFIADRLQSAKYVTREFQDYGYRLAVKLDDLEHKALYIKLAKEVQRPLLDQALSYTLDYPKVKSKGKVFMWKLSELRKEQKQKQRDAETKNATLPLQL